MRRWSFVAGSEIGPKSVNEDAVVVCRRKFQKRSYGALVLCDGVSGLTGSKPCANRVADICAEAVNQYLDVNKSRRPFSIKECDAFGIHLTKAMSSLEGNPGHGTTVALALLSHRSALVAWVGDTRIYALDHDGALIQLTVDHQNQQGQLTKLIRGDGIVVGGFQIRQFNMRDLVAIIGTTDGVHEHCSNEELRRFLLGCMANRLRDSSALRERLEKFLQANISDNATIAMAYELISIKRLNAMASKLFDPKS